MTEMVVSAVLDPAVLEASRFEDSGYATQARLFLRGIAQNGFLLVDPERRLHNAVAEQLRALPTKHGQRIQILWEECCKTSKHVMRCDRQRFGALGNVPIGDVARHCGRRCSVDAIISTESEEPNVESIRAYDESPFEATRCAFLAGSGRLDRMPRPQVNELLVRAIRFAKWLRFYDKQIGKGGDNLDDFRKGLEHILALWQEHRHFIDGPPGDVTIYTCEAGSSPQENSRAMEKVRNEILAPLRSKFGKFGFRICLELKQLRNKAERELTHPRYLQAQGTIVLFERGFDFVRRDNKGFRCTTLKLDPKAEDILREYRALPGSTY
ncbi:MAG: hypothetical protein IT365_04245 [Candidatus Hydrogenedentes bacterium]|nr:hypothetical protein [Candidatus Hydrogenedentota bacterium]